MKLLVFWALTALTAVSIAADLLSDMYIKDTAIRHGWDLNATIFILGWIAMAVWLVTT